MSLTDPISDMMVRIKNAQAVRHETVSIPFSKMKLALATILKKAGYVGDFERTKKKAKKAEHEFLLITLKYDDGFSALTGVKMISRPSRRMYIKANEIKPVRSGHGLSIISTPKGIMDSHEARKQHLGGEIICEVW